MNIDVVATLAGVAFFAGFFDAIAGGGGLITLPALLLSGIDPLTAIATNKFQAASATISATATYAKKGLIDWDEGKLLIPFGIAGGVCGALFASLLERQWFEAGVPVLLVIVAVYFACAPKLGDESRGGRMSIFLFSTTLAPLLGSTMGFLAQESARSF